VSVTIAFDTERRRPGCILIQALMGASVGLDPAARNRFLLEFDSGTWLLDMTPGMRLYQIDAEQIPELARIARLTPWRRR
jgi:hypothetical protein